MKNCKHEKVCQECVQQEIKKHEEAIAESNKKLPNNTNIYGGWTLVGQTYPIGTIHYHGDNVRQNALCTIVLC